jgi:hypothetical protein
VERAGVSDQIGFTRIFLKEVVSRTFWKLAMNTEKN